MPPVSATVTFNADDPADLGTMLIAFGETLRAVGGGAPEGSADTDAVLPSLTGTLPASAALWYRLHGREFIGRLRENARKALAVIVREGPTVPFERVRQELDMKGSALAGSLASIGAAVKSLGAPAPPFRPDHKRQFYTIDPDVQEALREVIA